MGEPPGAQRVRSDPGDARDGGRPGEVLHGAKGPEVLGQKHPGNPEAHEVLHEIDAFRTFHFFMLTS
jgi:hypothetical protein